MSRGKFRVLVRKLVKLYGVVSYLNNMDDVEVDNLWFTCPECYEVIDYDDWSDNAELHAGRCPVCGEILIFS